jgi:hypothetical protein
LARHDGDLRGQPQDRLSLAELIALLGPAAEGEARLRDEAIACFLSGSEGWSEAVKRLGGTFAEGAAGLRDRKTD